MRRIALIVCTSTLLPAGLALASGATTYKGTTDTGNPFSRDRITLTVKTGKVVHVSVSSLRARCAPPGQFAYEHIAGVSVAVSLPITNNRFSGTFKGKDSAGDSFTGKINGTFTTGSPPLTGSFKAAVFDPLSPTSKKTTTCHTGEVTYTASQK